MKKIAVFFLVCLSMRLTPIVYAEPVSAKTQWLSLEKALSLTLKADTELSVVQNQWQFKSAELKALKLVEPYWQGEERFVLPPSQAQMGLRQRAKAIHQEQSSLKRQYKDRALKLLNDTRQQYFQLMMTEAARDFEYERIQNTQSAYAILYPQYLKGKVSADTLKVNQNTLKEAVQNYDTTSAAAINLRNSLSLQMGGAALDGVTFEIPAMMPLISTEEAFLNQFIKTAENQLTSVLEASDSASKAEKELMELVALYELEYPTGIQGLKKVLDKDVRDYETVFNQYLQMTNTSGAGLLLKAEPPKAYPVVQGFYKHIIPVEWLGEAPGALTYWQQLPSPINSALVAYDLRRHEMQIAKDQLVKALQEPYSNLGLMRSTQLESEKSLSLSLALHEKLKKANLLGLTQYADVLDMQATVKRLELDVLQNKLQMYQQVSQLEYLSEGAFGALIQETSIGDIKRIETALNLPLEKAENMGSAYWTVETNESKLKFELRVIVPNKSKISHYQLFDGSGTALSKPIPVKTVLIHEPLVYQANSKLTLVLYEKEKAVYTFKISADAIAGRLKL